MNKAIAVLSGIMKKDEKGIWRMTDFGDFGYGLRVVATNWLYKDDPSLFIIAVGGKGVFKNIEGAPNSSAVIKQELIELGVLSDNILEKSKSGTTYEQLQELKKTIENKKLEKLTIISNRYHIPRIETFIEQDTELQKLLLLGIITIASAEDILLDHDRGFWKDLIEKVYKSEKMKKIVMAEQKGIKDIKSGKYKY